MPSPAYLFASIVFSTIGLAAFLYGKKQALAPPLMIGVALMLAPYFLPGTVWLCSVSLALLGALYWLRN